MLTGLCADFLGRKSQRVFPGGLKFEPSASTHPFPLGKALLSVGPQKRPHPETEMKQEAKRPREEPGIPVAVTPMPFSMAYSKEGMKVVLKLAPGVEELPKDELTFLRMCRGSSVHLRTLLRIGRPGIHKSPKS